jgi:hypothetical protein
MTTTDPAWLYQGAEVAVSSGGTGITFVTVARLTPTRVILPDGRRFTRGGDYFQTDAGSNNVYRLYDPHSPEVVNRVARTELATVLHHAHHLITSRVETPVSLMTAAQCRDTIADLIDRLQKARKEIDRRAFAAEAADAHAEEAGS